MCNCLVQASTLQQVGDVAEDVVPALQYAMLGYDIL